MMELPHTPAEEGRGETTTPVEQSSDNGQAIFEFSMYNSNSNYAERATVSGINLTREALLPRLQSVKLVSDTVALRVNSTK